MATRHLLVTGGAGFIGSTLVRQVLAQEPSIRITVLDKLTYAGNRANLDAVTSVPGNNRRLTLVVGDVADAGVVSALVTDCDGVINFAAETHVDRSILGSDDLLRTNVNGVQVLIEACRRELERYRAGERATAPRFLQVSTDEVYGPIELGSSDENDPLAPRSPYAATKAAAELLVRSYFVSFDLDVVITRGANTYGPTQHPEKLIPLFVTNAIDGLPLPLYGDGLQRRDWLHVNDHATAIWQVFVHGRRGEVYNVPGDHEMTNRELTSRLLERLGRPWSLVRSVADRPGHDRRYAMDGSKLAALGWRQRMSFEEGLAATIDWYVANESWWRTARSGDWHTYYQRQYGERLLQSTAAE